MIRLEGGLDMSKAKAYWILQFLGWGAYLILNIILVVSMSPVWEWNYLISYLFMVVVGMVLTHVYRAYINYQNWKALPISRLVINVFVASILVSLIWALITIPFSLLFLKNPESELINSDSSQISSLSIAWAIFTNYSIVIFGWSLIYFGYHFFSSFKESQIEKWRLEAAVKDAELMALKAQINPHFIFNSLNNIRSLVAEDPEKSRDMITHLSDLLRYAIQFSNQETVSLEKEIEVVQNYLGLESIQFEERLRYEFDIDPATRDLRIPPMVVQLLVENAIKHSIAYLPEGGFIKVSSKLISDVLHVEVLNTGQLKQKTNGKGIGLKNASERLQLLFGKLSTLQVKNAGPNTVSATFTLPLKHKEYESIDH
jgi:two-component system LytT family sensor kinase